MWKLSRLGVVFGLVALLLGFAVGKAADLVTVDTNFQGNAVIVAASAKLRVSSALIWQTLTDYDHLADFVPGMTGSRVLARKGATITVEQTGFVGFLPPFPVSIVVEVREDPPSTITMKLLSGNLRQLSGVYRIDNTAQGDENVLRWNGVVEPDIVLPPIFGAIVLRETIGDQFRGVVSEIERRAADKSTRAP
jgi:ribosome-associated toxin RatA of RatAB toxin-antitoxin module